MAAQVVKELVTKYTLQVEGETKVKKALESTAQAGERASKSASKLSRGFVAGRPVGDSLSSMMARDEATAMRAGTRSRRLAAVAAGRAAQSSASTAAGAGGLAAVGGVGLGAAAGTAIAAGIAAGIAKGMPATTSRISGFFDRLGRGFEVIGNGLDRLISGIQVDLAAAERSADRIEKGKAAFRAAVVANAEAGGGGGARYVAESMGQLRKERAQREDPQRSLQKRIERAQREIWAVEDEADAINDPLMKGARKKRAELEAWKEAQKSNTHLAAIERNTKEALDFSKVALGGGELARLGVTAVESRGIRGGGRGQGRVAGIAQAIHSAINESVSEALGAHARRSMG